jgi:hypothetical protein
LTKTNVKTTTEKSSSSLLQRSQQSPFFSKRGEDSFFAASGVQAKIEVGQPGDKYEQEADAMADQVMRQSVASPSEKREGEKVQIKPLADSITPVVRWMPEEKEATEAAEAPSPEPQFLQTQSEATAAAPTMGPAVESWLQASQGGGTPLPTRTREEMETGFGTDFGGVRVHTDAEAVRMNRELGAQAFTHGSDLYFNDGKYNPESADGKRLLAHELTHTVQQGKAPGLQAKFSHTSLSLQKANEPEASEADKIKTIAALPEGSIVISGNSFEIRLTNFPVKQYASAINSAATTEQPPAHIMPKPGTRKTKQDKLWRDEMAGPIKQSLEKVVDDSIKNDNPLSLKLKNLGSAKKEKTEVIGDLDTLAKEIIVPFWNLGGYPMIHQIEHKIDWQILGDDADKIENLILIDRESNAELGQIVSKWIRERVKRLLDHYRSKGIASLVERAEQALFDYTVKFESFKTESTPTRSVLATSNLRPTGGNNAINKSNIDVKKAEIPKGQFLFKTAKKGAGYLVPYIFSNEFIEIKGNADTHKLESVKLKKVVKDNSGSLENADEAKAVGFKEEKQDVYKMDNNGLAGTLKNILRLKYLSPIKLDDDVDFAPFTGLQATGKVDSDIPFLKGVPIDFFIEGSNFTVQATVTTDRLKDKLPKPLSVHYSSLTLAVSTQKGLSMAGEVGFGIEKVGKGYVGAAVTSKGFALEGKFGFDNAKFFKKAEVGFKYTEKEWKIDGLLAVDKGKITGIESAEVKISYDGKKLTGDGEAKLAIPGIDKVIVSAFFEESGSFSVTGEAKLGKIPGIKSGDAKVTVTKKENVYELSMSGSATPDLPKIPGLAASFAVSYDKGLFKIEGEANYKKGKFDGKLKVGVTNGALDEKGNIVAGKEGGETVTVYGSGKITIHVIKELTAELEAAVNPKGEVLIWGAIKLDASPFKKIHTDKTLFDISKNIPIFGVPFANVFVRIGADAKFYFDWEPLNIKIDTILDKATIDDIEQGKLSGAIQVGLYSNANAGIKLTVSVGAGVAVAIVAVSANIGGAIGFEIAGKLGAEATGKWNTQKGLLIESAEGILKAEPKALLELSGNIKVELDLLIDKVPVYTHELGSAQKKIDLREYGLDVTVPMKFNDKGDLEGINYEKMTVKPAFDKDSGEQLLDKALNPEKANAPQKVSKEESAKQAIRETVSSRMRAKRAKSSADLYTYGTDLRKHLLKTTSKELTNFVLQVVEDELRSIEMEDFTAFRFEILSSKETLKVKLQKIDAFEKQHLTVNKEDLKILREEVTSQAQQPVSTVQTKRAADASDANTLPIGSPDDPFEREADAIADQVMRQSEAPPAEQREEEKVQTKPLAGSIPPLVRRKPEQEEDSASAAASAPEEQLLQNKIEPGAPSPAVSPAVESWLQASQGGGTPLPTRTREEMEAGFGTDFGGVRVHTDAEAVQLNRELGAQAFTHGNNLYFNAGKYNPASSDGRRLLAHELTHTVQQGKNRQPSRIQRAGDAGEEDRPTSFKGPTGSVERTGRTYRLVINQLRLPRFKVPLTTVPFTLPKTDREDTQRETWDADMASSTAFDTLLEDKRKAEKAPQATLPGNLPIYALKLKGASGNYVVGEKEAIKQKILRPYWNRRGQVNVHHVDHKHELQLGGGEGIENLWLLDAVANQSSGSNIRVEKNIKIDALLREATGPGADKIWRRKPALETVKTSPSYTIVVQEVKAGLAPAGNVRSSYTRKQLHDQVESLQGLRFLNKKEIDTLGLHRDDQLLLFSNSAGGAMHKVEGWDKDRGTKKVKVPLGRKIATTSLTFNPLTGGTITSDFFRSDKYLNPAQVPLPIKPFPGFPMAGYIPGGHELINQINLSSKLFSPIRLHEGEMVIGKGLSVRGEILPDLPFLKSGLGIELVIEGDDIYLEKQFTFGDVKLPKPFNITDISLALSAGTHGLKASGSVHFEIERLGEGHVEGYVGPDGKFSIRGEFAFNKKPISGKVKARYEKGQWFLSGEASIGKDKIKGLDSLKVGIAYEEGALTGEGKALLSVPGVREVNIKIVVDEKGNFSIEGEADLSKIPKLKEASGKLFIARKDQDWEIAIEGEAKPDLNISGLEIKKARFAYQKGIFDLTAQAHFRKGKIEGDITAGATNKPVTQEGRKGEGEPGREINFYADGLLQVPVAKGIKAGVNVKVKPDGDLLIAGKVELTDDKYLIQGKKANKNTDTSLNLFSFDRSIPVASCGVASVELGLLAGVGLFYEFDGLKLDKGSNVQLNEVSLNNLSNVSLSSKISLSTGLRAGVEACIGAKAALVVLIAGIEGKGTIELTFTAIDAKATALVAADLSPEKGIQFKEASIDLDIYSKIAFAVSLGVRVYLDLLLGTVTLWSHTWKPDALKGERAFPLFDGNLAVPLKFGDNNSLSFEDVTKGIKSPLEQKAKNEETYVKGASKAVNDEGPSQAEKDEEAKQNIKKDLKEIYRGPYSRLVFTFDQTLDPGYFEERAGLWYRLQGMENLDPKIKAQFADEIKGYEFEEYEAFGSFLSSDTYFDAGTKDMLIDEFILNRPTLGETERMNLRSLVEREKPEKERSGKGKTGKGKNKPASVSRKPLPPAGQPAMSAEFASFEPAPGLADKAGMDARQRQLEPIMVGENMRAIRPELAIGTAVRRFAGEF